MTTCCDSGSATYHLLSRRLAASRQDTPRSDLDMRGESNSCPVLGEPERGVAQGLRGTPRLALNDLVPDRPLRLRVM